MIYTRKIQHLLGMLLLTLVWSAQAAAATYYVTSEPYSTGTGEVLGTFSDTMNLSGQVTVDDSIPSLDSWTDISSYVTSYSFGDGVNTFTQANSTLGRAEAITDGNGEVTNLVLEFFNPAPPHSIGTMLSFLGFETSIYNPDQGDLDAVDDISCTEVVNDVCEDGGAAAGSISFDTDDGGFIQVTLSGSPPPSDGPVNLSGNVQNSGGTPLCAMVLASGQFQFSCDPNGPFSLTSLPREGDGTVKRQVYVDGFFPKVEVLQGSGSETVVMQRSGTCPNYNMPYSPVASPGSAGKRVDIRGAILLGNSGTPLCAMVLANGQFVFSCDGSGNYNMNIPLDGNGQFKLQVYADGFAPYTSRYDEVSLVNDAQMARASECK
jgi:hypothetical protein